jgi:hypothetical protein
MTSFMISVAPPQIRVTRVSAQARRRRTRPCSRSDEAGNLIMLGSGAQHWSTIHAADLADLFRRVIEDDSPRGYYVAGDGLNPTVAELTEAAAAASGAPGAVAGSEEEARARLGDYFAEVLLLDQSTDAARARTELGWSASHPGLVAAATEATERTTWSTRRCHPEEAADRLAIRELIDAYSHCADRRDAEGQKALFTEHTRFVAYMDGVGTGPTEDLRGREALTPVFDASTTR